MNDRQDLGETGVDALRSRMDADARFHRVLSGYDPDEVRAYLEDMKRVFVQMSNAAKREQESLIAEVNSVRNEIQARNCVIKRLQETLAQREAQLNDANKRIATMLESVKKFEAEREGLERLRAAAAATRVATERARVLETEVQQLRGTLSQAANLIESWKAERVRLTDENTRLQQELENMRGLIKSNAPERSATRMPPVPAPQTFASATMPEQADSSKIADKLASAFAEAYTLVSQLRTTGESPRAAQPRMQVLRPDGTSADYTINEK
ncbi:MAG: hypothetical protein ABFD11_13660 [Christensenella sp.]